MKSTFRLNIKSLLAILLLTISLFPISAKDREIDTTKDYILMINPDAETCAWGETLIPMLSKELAQLHPEMNVYIEYMYALGITDMSGIDAFKEHLFSKYTKPPKYLMLFESDSYALLENDIDNHWGKDLPTLLITREDFVGPEDYYLQRLPIPEKDRVYLKDIAQKRDNLTVIYNMFDIPGTIDIMRDMYPDMNTIIFITDGRYISAENRKEVEDAAAKHSIKVVHLTPDKLTTDQLIQRFSEIPDGTETQILYFTWFNNELTGDKDLVLQTNAYRIFSLYVNLPVFTINDVGLTHSGMLGGKYTRFEQVYNTTLNAMNDIIAGKPLVREVNPPAPLPTFNYLTMQNHNIKESDIPSNSYLYYRPLTFLEKNKDLILGLAIIIFLSIVFTRIILLIKTKKMQDKEIKLLEKYSDLVNNMPIGYQQEQLIFNEAGEPVDYIVTEVNPSFETQLTQSEDILGKKGSETNPELVTELVNIYKLILEGKTKRVNFSYYHKESDHYFSIIITPSSKPGNMDLFFTDTTELFKTQQLLRTVNSKLSMSLDIADIVPWKWELNDKIMIFDQDRSADQVATGEEHSGHSLVIGDDEYFRRIHEDDRERVRNTFDELIKGIIPKAKEEYRILNVEKGGMTYDWVEAQAAVEKRDKNGKPVSLIGSSLDITERKTIEEELVRAKEKAEESNRLKSAFLANMSHEIRTPLNAIVGFSNILASTEEEEEKMEYINIIENNNSLLLQLVSDILDLSKLEAGTMEMHYLDVDLNKAMEEQIEPTQDKAVPGVDVIFEQRENDCYVHVEKYKLLQILTNFLTNAAKFTEQGEIRYGYKILDDKMLRVYVTDTGKGISKDQQENIFGRFVKLDYFKQGAGLGLSLCQNLVEHFGGEIGVDSEEGKGSTFWFTFPYERVNTDEPATENPQPQGEKERVKVLIAEDVPSNFELFEYILKRDFDLYHAWDGKEAVEMFKEHKPHIVLMDINMPKLNGYEATQEIRKLSKDVPIIAVTAYAFSNDERQIRKNGFDAYSPKPLNAHTLKQQMTDLLSGKVAVI